MSLSHSPSIVTNGLVLLLDAANSKSYPGTGAAWTDLSGNGNTGTLTNGPTYSNVNNGSIVFDGVDDYALVTNPATLRNQNFTLSVWINPATQTKGIVSIVDFDHASGPSQGWVLQSEDATTNRNYYLAWYTGTQFQPTGGGGFGSGKGIQITTSVWQNIVYCKNGTSLLGYMNGTQVYTGTATDSTVSYPINRNLRVGNYVQDASRGFTGNIATAQIYNRALSATEVLQNFVALRGRYGI